MKLLRPVAIWLGARTWLSRYSKIIVGLDKFIQTATRHRLTLLMFAGLPELMLTVRGRKTGIERTTPLLCVPHEGGWLVAGSNWGAPKPPAWVGNVLAADSVGVTYGGRQRVCDARKVEGAERAELWQVMLKTWPNYAKYAERTDREIPVIRLTPR